MKNLFLIFFTLIISQFSFSQEEKIKEIRQHFEYINKQTDYEILHLKNQDYIEYSDMGCISRAYFKNDTIYKIVEQAYTNYYNSLSEYYFWNGELIFVFHKENSYESILDEDSSFIEFNYDKQYESFTGRYYFDAKKEIKRIEKGEAYSSVIHKINAESLLSEFLNVHNNYDTYLLLQGKWYEKKNSDNSLFFENRNVQFNYFKKEEDFHYIVTGNLIQLGWDDDETGKNTYAIEKIDDRNLILRNKLTKQKIIFYKTKKSKNSPKIFYEQE